MKIHLKKITLELDDSLIKRAKAYDIDEDELVQMFLRSLIHPLWEAVWRLEKKYCPKCKKERQTQMTRNHVMAVNRGGKTIDELGYCTCDD